jgi:hypothetical protein
MFPGRTPLNPKTGLSPAQENPQTGTSNVVAIEDFVQSRNAKAILSNFSEQLAHFKQWRDDLAQAIADYQSWTEAQGLTDGEQDLRVYELIETLQSDKLTVALVAEFSRGKTELLNAIFFSDYKQRLLPSSAGRTTMCPTELRWDEKDGPCVKLLPIETRKTALTISEYKRTGTDDTAYSEAESPRSTRGFVRNYQNEKGQYPRRRNCLIPGRRRETAPRDDRSSGRRHAIINFPHPLLKQGW